jgi:hypothetical protein
MLIEILHRFACRLILTLALIIVSFWTAGCAVTYTQAPAAAVNAWTMVGKEEWVHYDGVATLTASIRAGTLLFHRTAPCPRGSRVSHSTLGWVAGDQRSYAANSCRNEKPVVDVSRFNREWFVNGLPLYLQLAYRETVVLRRRR